MIFANGILKRFENKKNIQNSACVAGDEIHIFLHIQKYVWMSQMQLLQS